MHLLARTVPQIARYCSLCKVIHRPLTVTDRMIIVKHSPNAEPVCDDVIVARAPQSDDVSTRRGDVD